MASDSTDNGPTLYGTTDYFQPFPRPEDVFASSVDDHAELLLPAGSLSLAHISPDWEGWVHFLIPVEPLPGFGPLGQESTPYHTYLCRPNWLAFSLSGDKCELACNLRFFHKEFYSSHPPCTELQMLEFNDIPAHYERTRRHFAMTAEHFKKHGWLCGHLDQWNPSEHDPKEWRRPLVIELGGTSYEGNWSDDEFPTSCQDNADDDVVDFFPVVPRTADGRDFTYIASLELSHYTGPSNGVLLLFYDHVTRIALTTIDWT